MYLHMHKSRLLEQGRPAKITILHFDQAEEKPHWQPEANSDQGKKHVRPMIHGFQMPRDILPTVAAIHRGCLLRHGCYPFLLKIERRTMFMLYMVLSAGETIHKNFRHEKDQINKAPDQRYDLQPEGLLVETLCPHLFSVLQAKSIVGVA